MKNTNRRRFTLGALATLGLPMINASVWAADAYPSRIIKWIVPYLAGTSPDTTVRILAPEVGRLLGQVVVVENKGGAAGNIGARLAATAPADGYTWVYSASPMAASMRMYKEPGYDALKDFRHIMRLTSTDSVLVVNADSPIKTFADLLAAVRAQPGKVDYSSGGVGSPSHLGVELLLSTEGLTATHIPYKGASELVNAVLSNQVRFGLPISSVAVPLIQGNKLRALAVTGGKRSQALPQVPTLAELGVKGVEMTSWGGVSVPAGTPEAVVARIHGAFETAMKNPEVLARIRQTGSLIDIQDSATYVRGFTQEMEMTEVMMKRVGLKAI